MPLISSCELLRCKVGVFLRPSKDVVGVGCKCKFAVKGIIVGMISNHLLALGSDSPKYPLPFEFMVAHCGQ